MARPPEITQRSGDGRPVSNERRPRWLLVAGDGHLSMHPLPMEGELVVGREPSCDVRLEHAKISRRHARFVVTGGLEVQVEDLGSTNGIRVGDRKLERGVPVPLRIGDSVQLGPYTAMLFDGRGGPRSEDGAPRAAIVVRDPTPAGANELIGRIARSGVSVLLQAETGAGKEVLARTIHDLSGRTGQLVAINCATLGDQLLESELFGHERGAFTGAVKAKQGLLEVSHGGTMFLDEIGDLSQPLQAKLLRALETHSILRVGSTTPIELDLRVIAATHRDLAADVAEGRFRRDLYFRLNGITLRIPPLRERRDAIPALVTSLLADVAKGQGGAPTAVDPKALARLVEHDWPGNVRELRQVIERAMLLAAGRTIQLSHLVIDAVAPSTATPAPPATATATSAAPVKDAPASDAASFLAVARTHHGNVSAIAQALGTSRSQVRRLAKRYGVDLDDLRST